MELGPPGETYLAATRKGLLRIETELRKLQAKVIVLPKEKIVRGIKDRIAVYRRELLGHVFEFLLPASSHEYRRVVRGTNDCGRTGSGVFLASGHYRIVAAPRLPERPRPNGICLRCPARAGVS